MGNTESYQAPVVVLTIPAQTKAITIPSDEVILQKQRNYGDVDRVLAVSYTFSSDIPTPERAEVEFKAGIGSQAGTVAMLQRTWQSRKGKKMMVENISAENIATLGAITTNSRVLLIGDIGEKPVAGPDNSTEPVLFGTNASHSPKDISNALSPFWSTLSTNLDNCIHINLYYTGMPCQAFVSQLINEMAKKNIYICIRATNREDPRQCAFYFNKLALHQFEQCPAA